MQLRIAYKKILFIIGEINESASDWVNIRISKLKSLEYREILFISPIN